MVGRMLWWIPCASSIPAHLEPDSYHITHEMLVQREILDSPFWLPGSSLQTFGR